MKIISCKFYTTITHLTPIPPFKNFTMELPDALIIRPRNWRCAESAKYSTKFLFRWWKRIITYENKQNSLLSAAIVIAFAASNTLPKDITREFVRFLPISIPTIAKITDLVQRHQRKDILINGRGGEGLEMPLFLTPLSEHKLWLLKNQQPRLRFSQPDFRKQIRERAHLTLFRQLAFSGDIQTQLSAFVSYLINNY